MKATVKARIKPVFTIQLSEQEARALEALIGYGIKPFLEVFYEKMGKAYLQPHEAGLRELFDTFGDIASGLNRSDLAKKAFSGEYRLVKKETEA